MNPNETPKIEAEKKPEEKDKKEAFTSIVRVLGRKYEDISEEEREGILGAAEAVFKDQKGYKEYLLETFGNRENIPDKYIRTIFYERPKTQEEQEIIRILNEETNKLRKKYDLPELNIPAENIYVVPNDAPWPLESGDNCYFLPYGQFIVIRESDFEQMRNIKSIFAKEVIHEMIHFKSYNSLKKFNSSENITAYRSGLESFKRDDVTESYLNILNEAIAEELTIRLFNKLRENPLFKEESEQTEKLKSILANRKDGEGESLIKGDEFFIKFDQENSVLWPMHLPKERERRILDKLIDKIFEKNPKEFENGEEVFNVFVEAVMTGRIIRLGKLIDNTFGKKTFHALAEIRDIGELEKYVENLQ